MCFSKRGYTYNVLYYVNMQRSVRSCRQCRRTHAYYTGLNRRSSSLPLTINTAVCSKTPARFVATHVYEPRWYSVTEGISNMTIFFPIRLSNMGSGNGPNVLLPTLRNVQVMLMGMSPRATWQVSCALSPTLNSPSTENAIIEGGTKNKTNF